MNLRSTSYHVACASLMVLAFLCVAWEAFLAPLRPGGSLLTLKAVPLLVPLFGLLREKLYTYRWTSLLSLAYFTEGAVRAWSDRGLSQGLALVEVALALLLFAGCLGYVRSHTHPARAA